MRRSGEGLGEGLGEVAVAEFEGGGCLFGSL